MSGRTPQFIFDGRDGERTYSGAVDRIRADEIGEVDEAFARLEAALDSGLHAAGYFTYELGFAFEPRLVPLMPRRRNLPLLWLGIFDRCEIRDENADAILPRNHAGRLVHEWCAARHEAAFERVHALIAAGDLYQANLSYRSRFAFAGDPLALYRELRAKAGARHCAFVDDGERTILSLSPELFFDLSPSGLIGTRPMKGTAARGANAEEDNAARARLAESEKERAENLMIVDLLRNDLSRIAIPGSVEVEKLFEVETYPTVHQMVSVVSARLRPGTRPEAILRALFPCGSVTGAPKIRAMEVIREVETSERGIYCGAIGHFAPDGSARFNVAIRTLAITGSVGELGIGGAIVCDSRPTAEYEECLVKARFYEVARRPLQLIETLRHEAGQFVRVDRHLARMAASAEALGFVFDFGVAHEALGRCVLGRDEPSRVRLILDEDGTLAAEARPCVETVAPWRFAISPRGVSSRDPLLRHKTSRREHFDGEQARLSSALGCDEVLFLNERGELTEGSRANIFVEIDGVLLTPALSCGLLDGCLRREILERGGCAEAFLRPADLDRAERIFLGNSLRGLIPAVGCASNQSVPNPPSPPARTA
ncbi:MAG TPA: aminodeoxychorismate synthase component I [Rhizomicrobium sp.]